MENHLILLDDMDLLPCRMELFWGQIRGRLRGTSCATRTAKRSIILLPTSGAVEPAPLQTLRTSPVSHPEADVLSPCCNPDKFCRTIVRPSASARQAELKPTTLVY
jgi:hypothetical protein